MSSGQEDLKRQSLLGWRLEDVLDDLRSSEQFFPEHAVRYQQSMAAYGRLKGMGALTMGDVVTLLDTKAVSADEVRDWLVDDIGPAGNRLCLSVIAARYSELAEELRPAIERLIHAEAWVTARQAELGSDGPTMRESD